MSEEGDECIHLVYLYNTDDVSGNSINYQLVSHGHAWVTLTSELSVSTEKLDDVLIEQNKTGEKLFCGSKCHKLFRFSFMSCIIVRCMATPT